MKSNFTRSRYMEMVHRAKKYILAGDVSHVVLSQRITRQTVASPFGIYRALRRLNPSPYMIFFNFGYLSGTKPLYIISASPETHVCLKQGIASARPIAGTRSRGSTLDQDKLLEHDLLADAKECTEHKMMVDLGSPGIRGVAPIYAVKKKVDNHSNQG